MTVIDEHGTKLTGHAATVYHSDHPELIEINPMEYIHPGQTFVYEPTELFVSCAAEVHGLSDR